MLAVSLLRSHGPRTPEAPAWLAGQHELMYSFSSHKGMFKFLVKKEKDTSGTSGCNFLKIGLSYKYRMNRSKIYQLVDEDTSEMIKLVQRALRGPEHF